VSDINFTESRRVTENIKVLLTRGIFPGIFAPVLAEAITFLDSAINAMPEVISGASNRSPEDEGRLADGGV